MVRAETSAGHRGNDKGTGCGFREELPLFPSRGACGHRRGVQNTLRIFYESVVVSAVHQHCCVFAPISKELRDLRLFFFFFYCMYTKGTKYCWQVFLNYSSFSYNII